MNLPKHFVSAAAVVLNDNNEILLIRGPQRGWEMPGGVVEVGESLAQAAIRETKEEAGVDIEIIRFCGIFQNVKASIYNTLFLAKYVGGTPVATTESLESGFFPLDKALNMVTYMNFKERIEVCLRPVHEPVYIEF